MRVADAVADVELKADADGAIVEIVNFVMAESIVVRIGDPDAGTDFWKLDLAFAFDYVVVDDGVLRDIVVVVERFGVAPNSDGPVADAVNRAVQDLVAVAGGAQADR